MWTPFGASGGQDGAGRGLRARCALILCVLALCALLLFVLLLVAGASPAQARPLQVDDLLNREGFGAVTAAPGGRWLLVEQRRPYAAAKRFDYQLENFLFRTRLMVSDLRSPGPLRALAPAEPGVGYQLGPASPDGERVVVYRLKAERWEMGIATPASGSVHWLGLTPELPQGERLAVWTTPTRLVMIARQAGDQPFNLRWMHPQGPLPGLWARTARGGTAVTVVGSGRYLAARPKAAAKRVVEVSVLTGAARTLAVGDFTDLELSTSGRWLAAFEAGEDIPLSAQRQVQGAYGVAARRLRLVLIDLAMGSITRPCPRCDMLSGLLSWSPVGDELLAFAREDGAAWPAGRLIRVEAVSGQVRPAGDAIAPVIERRPERAYAGWMGAEPIVFGRPDPAARLDWYRLTPGGAVNLTRSLSAPPRTGLVASDDAILLAADDAAWRFDRDGAPTRLGSCRLSGLPRSADPRPDRTIVTPVFGDGLFGLCHRPDADVLERIDAGGGVKAQSRLAPHSEVLAVAPGGAVTLRTTGGGQNDLVWQEGGRTAILARINARFADIDLPRAIPVPHPGPNGEALTSWILLPATSIVPGRPPPLIVAPYLGSSYASSPLDWVFQEGPGEPEALLAAHGYAVLIPSLPTRRNSDGPADGLADQILAIVDAAARQPDVAGAFDPHRLGIWGHSFGGYSTLAVITQTDRFGAAVAEAATSDLFSIHGTFSPGRRVYPDEGVSSPWTAGWAESLQGDMRRPPFLDPDRYARNSPAFQASRVETPLMLVHGDLDNMSIGQAEEMFSALYRQNKDALLVTYWGEQHAFASPGNLRDLSRRIFDWFDSHLLTRSSADGAARSAGPGRIAANGAPRIRPPTP